MDGNRRFETPEDLDWGRSFHPHSIEICLNVTGHGCVRTSRIETFFAPLTAGFYRRGDRPLRGTRPANQRHQFLTVEMSFEFLQRHLTGLDATLHPIVREVVSGRPAMPAVAPATRLGSRQQRLLSSLLDAPVQSPARPLWYQAKALELAAEFLFRAPDGQEFFCQRQTRLAAERVERTLALLRKNLSQPPNLMEIGRFVGCSPFYLSRTFSTATGLTIPQYLRQLRMERAAELLRSGEFNVTEAAFEVGYSSLSHFSQAFHDTFGCCPGLYPLRTPTQKNLLKTRK